MEPPRLNCSCRDLGLDLSVSSGGAEPESRSWLPAMFTTLMHGSLSAIDRGRLPRLPGTDGRVVMEVVERAYASARQDA